MNNPISVVIVNRGVGYVAHIRYEDPKRDIDVSASTRADIFRLVGNKFRRQYGRKYMGHRTLRRY